MNVVTFGLSGQRTADGAGTTMRKTPQPKSAFTLVEVVLSLLVFGLGVLAVLALFPGGLLLSKRAHSDTYIAEFAEMALNAVGTELEITNVFWGAGFDSASANYHIGTAGPADTSWLDQDGIWISNGYVTLEYRIKDPIDSSTNYADRTLRYNLTLERKAGTMDELLVTPASKAVFTAVPNPNGTVTWQWIPRYCVPTSAVVRMDEHIIKAHLYVKPGPYGDSEQRYFFRYYFDYMNKDSTKY